MNNFGTIWLDIFLCLKMRLEVTGQLRAHITETWTSWCQRTGKLLHISSDVVLFDLTVHIEIYQTDALYFLFMSWMFIQFLLYSKKVQQSATKFIYES